MMINQKDDWSNRRYDLSFQNIIKKIPLKTVEHPPKSYLLEKITLSTLSNLVAYHIFFALQSKQMRRTRFPSSYLRGIEFSIITFNLKVIVDHLNIFQSEYHKGGLVGLASYLLNRPLQQIYTARSTIFANENKKIGILQAMRVIVKYDGLRGFYKHENFLAPTSATISRSIYFGLYHKLVLANQENINGAFQFGLFPLIASFGASSSTFLIDKLRNAFLLIHHQRDTSITKRSKKTLLEASSTTKDVFNMIAKGDFPITKSDFRAISFSIASNWVLLSLFAYSQSSNSLTIFKEIIGSWVNPTQE